MSSQVREFLANLPRDEILHIAGLMEEVMAKKDEAISLHCFKSWQKVSLSFLYSRLESQFRLLMGEKEVGNAARQQHRLVHLANFAALIVAKLADEEKKVCAEK